MQIGIIGTGSVGRALGRGWQAAGHDVVLGSRLPDGSETTPDDAPPVVDQAAAAEHGAVAVLAVPSIAVVDVATEFSDALTGKPVVDTTNEYPDRAADRSLGERVQEAVPASRVVKGFNTIGANRMTAAVIDGERATMFLAGDDPDAVDVASRLAGDLGFEPLVSGDLGAADRLEELARLWINLSERYGRDIGFRLLHDEPLGDPAT